MEADNRESEPGHPAKWIEEFLNSRSLDSPDGRPLYAYRCSQVEFESLARTLSATRPPIYQAGNHAMRAFVLYAGEWWQRRYQGGIWAWEPLLNSIGWVDVLYSELYGPIRNSLDWWKVSLVKLPSSFRYLGTLACQGGLPLALLGDTDSSVARYLRAVLTHVSEYREYVQDPIELAQDKQHLLYPPTLRRDYVFRLAAELVEAVLELQSSASASESPNELPHLSDEWRRKMPLDLEDHRARELLETLRQQAARNSVSPTKDFRVERFLRLTGVGWRLGARIRPPITISKTILQHQFKTTLSEERLGLQARTADGAVRTVGMYAMQGDNYILFRNLESNTEIWGDKAAAEIRLELLAGERIGHPMIPARGHALGDLPWSFRNSDDNLFLGEGSVASRSPEILVLTSDRFPPHTGTLVFTQVARERIHGKPIISKPVQLLDRYLWTIREKSIVETDCGRCVIKPSSESSREEDYSLTGSQVFDLECKWPLFQGAPRLRRSMSEGPRRFVSDDEVEWRQGSGEWVTHPTGYGLWEVRHTHAGELKYLGRTGILPEHLSVSIRPDEEINKGQIEFSSPDAIRIASDDTEIGLSLVHAREVVLVRVHAKEETAPPIRIRLRLHWPGGHEIRVQAPFPGHGGRFLYSSGTSDQYLAIEDLHGGRAIAFSPNESERFWVDGQLKDPGLGDLFRITNFKEPLRKSESRHELSLIDLRSLIEILLSASDSLDSYVSLGLVDGSQRIHHEIRVSRFSAILKCESTEKTISVSPTTVRHAVPTFEAFPLIRPEDEPTPLEILGPIDAPYGALLPMGVNLNEPWLVILRDDGQTRIRPVEIGGQARQQVIAELTTYGSPTLADALSIKDPALRRSVLESAMDEMLKDEDKERSESEWAFLTNALLRAQGLPATSLDVLKLIACKPRLLVASLFRLERVPRQQIWNLDSELPFSWLLVRRDDWWKEAKKAYARLKDQLAGVWENHEEAARELIGTVLKEGVEKMPALQTVQTDIEVRLLGGGVSLEFVRQMLTERADAAPEQIRLRERQDDWPKGYGRVEWNDELNNVPDALWYDKDQRLERQPIFDTPTAAAWCCFVPQPTKRTTFLVKRMREHDPIWFDLAYSTTWFQLAQRTDSIENNR